MYFNFKVNITARNPNKNTIVQKEYKFPSNRGVPGSNVIKLKPRQLAEYYNETRAGVYNDLAVDLDMTVRYKYGRIKSIRFNPPIVQCRLRVTLISNGTSTSSFNDTKCSNRYFFEDRDAERY
ncbi:unnamed protein product [Lupinus luteus]|uniref:Late embryogenesis abundant protein LEA-2 subgroup domain-containing protein n=1 Tax=Lupinus luteus TaxID=3873 RepID=A0AAV1YEX9_LUPLU